MDRCDLLVIGGGVVGLATARAFARRHPRASAIVLEKEPSVGAHASGRNSGVLHAGFYYPADSLKARFSVDGNREMVRYCVEHHLPLRRCGKLVVARGEGDLERFDGLLERARTNGVRLEDVTEREAARIEPRVRTFGRALWSPDTAVVDPAAVTAHLAREIAALGVDVRTSTRFTGRSGGIVTTTRGPIAAGVVLNGAGAYADRVAASWGVGGRYALVPFRGSYLLGGQDAPPLACCVYPVPPAGMPFLGVHLTVTVDGGVKIGPTAAPARWREDYGGLCGLVWSEGREQVAVQLELLRNNNGFRRHASREVLKHSRTFLVHEASSLVAGLRRRSFRRWGRPGIRAQLVERRTGTLVDDFVVEASGRSLHVLNAVSPAFTCSLPFAEHLTDRLEALGGPD